MAKTVIGLGVPLGVFLPLVFLSYIAVFLRFYTRIKIMKTRLQLDDWFILFALNVFGCQTLATCIGFTKGVGVHRHLLDDDPAKLVYIGRLKWVDSWLYFISSACIKFSVIWLYRRIFASTKYLRISLTLLFAFVVVHSIAGATSIIFNCWPVSYYWNRYIPGHEGKCASEKVIWFIFIGSNSFTDFATVLLPMPMVGSLNMNKRKRRGLMGLFMLSLVPCAISLIRYHSVWHIDDPDFTYWVWPALMWGGIELYLAFICACLPALVPLIYTYSPSFKSFMTMEKPPKNKKYHEQWLYAPGNRALAFERMGERNGTGGTELLKTWGSFGERESEDEGELVGWKGGVDKEMAKGGGSVVVVQTNDRGVWREEEGGIQVDTEISVMRSEVRKSWFGM